jgi:hypothetical protein
MARLYNPQTGRDRLRSRPVFILDYFVVSRRQNYVVRITPMKKFLVLIVLLLTILWLCIGGFPKLAHRTTVLCFPVVQADETVINPLKDVDMNDAKAFLILSLDDWSELPEGMPARRVLVCTDEEVLQQLKDNFSFEISGGDMSTAESELWVYSHDTLKLMTNIVIEQNRIGIQNELTGWAEAVNQKQLCRLFTQFKPYRWLRLDLRPN